jgi:hypothetical protein
MLNARVTFASAMGRARTRSQSSAVPSPNPRASGLDQRSMPLLRASS